MAFADPAVVTIASVAKNMVRINQDGYGSTYRLRGADDDFTLVVRNSSYKDKKSGANMDRHSVDLTHTIFATSTDPAIRRHCYIVVENQQGDTLADPVAMVVGLLTFLTASSGANVTKLLNFES
jgi:hypothetical protein